MFSAYNTAKAVRVGGNTEGSMPTIWNIRWNCNAAFHCRRRPIFHLNASPPFHRQHTVYWPLAEIMPSLFFPFGLLEQLAANMNAVEQDRNEMSSLPSFLVVISYCCTTTSLGRDLSRAVGLGGRAGVTVNALDLRLRKEPELTKKHYLRGEGPCTDIVLPWLNAASVYEHSYARYARH